MPVLLTLPAFRPAAIGHQRVWPQGSTRMTEDRSEEAAPMAPRPAGMHPKSSRDNASAWTHTGSRAAVESSGEQLHGPRGVNRRTGDISPDEAKGTASLGSRLSATQADMGNTTCGCRYKRCDAGRRLSRLRPFPLSVNRSREYLFTVRSESAKKPLVFCQFKTAPRQHGSLVSCTVHVSPPLFIPLPIPSSGLASSRAVTPLHLYY